jgi:hypothetical protein
MFITLDAMKVCGGFRGSLIGKVLTAWRLNVTEWM